MSRTPTAIVRTTKKTSVAIQTLPETPPLTPRRPNARVYWAAGALLVVLSGLGVLMTAQRRAAARKPGPQLASQDARPAETWIGPPTAPSRSTVARQPAASPNPIHETLKLPRTSAEAESAADDLFNFPETGDRPRPEPTEAFVGPPAPEPANPEPAAPGRPLPPVAAATDAPDAAPNGSFDTRLEFLSKTDAFVKAKTENKLVLLMECPGVFTDGAFECRAAERFRQACLLHEGVANLLREEFVCGYRPAAAAKRADGATAKGHLVIYLCHRNGSVFHALVDPTNEKDLLSELNWLADVLKVALADQRRDPSRSAFAIRQAHRERFLAVAEPDWNKKENKKAHFDRKLLKDLKDLAKLGGNGRPWNLEQDLFGEDERHSPANGAHNLPTQQPSHLAPAMQIHWYIARYPEPLPRLDPMTDWLHKTVLKN